MRTHCLNKKLTDTFDICLHTFLGKNLLTETFIKVYNSPIALQGRHRRHDRQDLGLAWILQNII